MTCCQWPLDIMGLTSPVSMGWYVWFTCLVCELITKQPKKKKKPKGQEQEGIGGGVKKFPV
jgi:hypothetical protein